MAHGDFLIWRPISHGEAKQITNSEQERQWFGQNGYRVRLEWGRRGAQAAATRGDILIVVDVLSFSTAVVTAVQRGALVFPCGKDEDAAALAARHEAVLAVGRQDVPTQGRFSLSPQTFFDIEPGARVVLASPNGATCSRYGKSVPRLYIGALVNAAAVAEAAARATAETEAAVTILACGERWESPGEDGSLRFAIEDYLGAGAILAHLPSPLPLSPEAEVCRAAFLPYRDDPEALLRLLLNCGSGVELIDKGYRGDVEHAAKLNLYPAVPRLSNEGYLFASPE